MTPQLKACIEANARPGLHGLASPLLAAANAIAAFYATVARDRRAWEVDIRMAGLEELMVHEGVSAETRGGEPAGAPEDLEQLDPERRAAALRLLAEGEGSSSSSSPTPKLNGRDLDGQDLAHPGPGAKGWTRAMVQRGRRARKGRRGGGW